jgi:hypothetical protein
LPAVIDTVAGVVSEAKAGALIMALERTMARLAARSRFFTTVTP